MTEAVPRAALRQSPSRRVGCLLASLSAALVIVLLGATLITYPLWLPWISGFFSPWPESPSPTSLNLHSVAMVSATDGWAVGDNVILHYTGGQWTAVHVHPKSTLFSVAMVSATDGWAVGDGVILHYSGSQWTQVSDPSSSVLASVALVSATDGWVVGWDGTILHYRSGN